MNKTGSRTGESTAPQEQAAGPGLRRLILILGILLAFAAGMAAGVGLAVHYGILQRESVLQMGERLSGAPSAGSVSEPSAVPAEELPTEPAAEPSAVHTEEPATEPSAVPTAEPATEPPTEQPTEPQTEPPTEPVSSGKDITGYILPNSNSEYLNPDDLRGMSHWELVLARNEIFARHGRRFNNPDLQEYFDRCTWYSGTIEPWAFDSSVFNDYELKNVNTLQAVELSQ